jgi:paraquat-inducible protein B
MKFDQSLRGLETGAPVEFLGVEIGEVVSIELDYNAQEDAFPLNVGAVIYPQMIGDAHQKLLDDLDSEDSTKGNARLLKKFVTKGMRAQAKTGNILTGQLFIALDFYPNAKPVAYDAGGRPLTVPTVPASLEKLQQQIEQFARKINELPLESISKNLNASLKSLQESLRSFDEGVIPDIARTLEEIRETMDSAAKLVDEDAPERTQLRETLQAVDRMTRSVRELSDYLKRNPESLIKGRPESSGYDAFE